MIKILRNYELVSKFIAFKYLVERPQHTVEENYVLAEIRKDHKLDSHRVFASGLALKIFIFVNGVKLIMQLPLSMSG